MAHALSLAQMGDQDDAAKVLKGFGGAGVLEVIEDDAGGTYRTVYTEKFAEAVFVLHCFQKRSKNGIATPKVDMDSIRARLKVVETRHRAQGAPRRRAGWTPDVRGRLAKCS